MRIKTSIMIDSDLWIDFQHYCLDERKELSEKLEEMIQKEVKKR